MVALGAMRWILVAKLLCADNLWRSLAVRVGDSDEVESAASPELHDVDINEGKGNVTEFLKFLVDRFSDQKQFPKDRKAIADIRTLDMSGGEKGNNKGSQDSVPRKFEYLGTSCMQERVHWAAEQLKAFRCRRILEVGGFRTPLPSIVHPEHLPGELELYVDVDPSAEATKLENYSVPSGTFQLILDEFRGPKNGGRKPHYGKDFDCYLQLGTSSQNIGSDDKKQAMENAMVSSNTVVVEFPFSNAESMDKELLPLMDRAGFAVESEHVVNCSQDQESLDKRDPEVDCGGSNDNTSCLVRQIVVYKRNFVASPQDVAKLVGKSEEKNEGKASKADSKHGGKVGKFVGKALAKHVADDNSPRRRRTDSKAEDFMSHDPAKANKAKESKGKDAKESKRGQDGRKGEEEKKDGGDQTDSEAKDDENSDGDGEKGSATAGGRADIRDTDD
eukprot:TRINITY_DN90688_c0_g1_i1.p1 TRINITY_DN90688_c0_g1~~TRINITY_DN90688_c0_g1_i1.p1  ORF type:complete len:446 (-),score=100.29 TRINITY_DN90688_c0_g1_i1:313-1650(-)